MFSIDKFFPLSAIFNDGITCWSKEERVQFFPELCCEPPSGFPNCFSDEYTYEYCCLRQNARPWLLHDHPAIPLPSLQEVHNFAPDLGRKLTVDFVVRSWHEDVELLAALLASVKIFWPFSRYQTHVVVVMDAEAPETEQACKEVEKHGTWVRCVGEALPSWLASNTQLKRPKAARVHWSTFWSDSYVPDADYVGIIDSDVIFHTYAPDALLFAPPLSSVHRSLYAHTRSAAEAKVASWPRPIIFGSWNSPFTFSALAVQDDYPQANFMDSLPMIMHREDFEALRHHMTDRFRLLSGRPALNFDEAFLLASVNIDKFAASTGWFANYQGEFLCFQAAMGAFIWRWRQSSYHFSVRGGYERGLAAHTTCPSLHAALHATELKRRAQYKSVSYFEEARSIMAAGICAAARVRGVLQRRFADRCRRVPYQAADLLTRPDDVGVGRNSWSTTTKISDHRCGPRTVSQLLADFWELLPECLGRRPGRRILSWALKGNGTGKYLDTEELLDRSGNRLEILNG